MLENNKKILSAEDQQHVLTEFNFALPRLINSNKKGVQSIHELLPQWINKSVYIIWDEENLPVIQTEFKRILDYIDDIAAVAFETWVVAIEMNQCIQFNARNKIIEINLEE